MATEEEQDADIQAVELPVRVFLYTLDQVAFVLGMAERHLKNNYVYFQGRTTGHNHSRFITARNIAAPTGVDWRVAETELVRWMKSKGFVFTRNGRVQK